MWKVLISYFFPHSHHLGNTRRKMSTISECEYTQPMPWARSVKEHQLTTFVSILPFVRGTGIPDGLLPRWLLVVAVTAQLNGATNFCNHKASAKVYSSAGAQSKYFAHAVTQYQPRPNFALIPLLALTFPSAFDVRPFEKSPLCPPDFSVSGT